MIANAVFRRSNSKINRFALVKGKYHVVFVAPKTVPFVVRNCARPRNGIPVVHNTRALYAGVL